jgi:hypothetical protein
MFDSSFPFSLIQRTPKNTGGVLAEYVFHFRTKKRRYIVVAEEYNHRVFAVKFYPADRKTDDHRFNIVLNDFEFAPIIRTCINVMQWLLEKYPTASFAYVGANSITPSHTESKAFTKRYRIYRYVMDVFLNPEKFERYFSTKNSAVLLVNNINENVPALAIAMIEMFMEIYDELEYYNQ